MRWIAANCPFSHVPHITTLVVLYLVMRPYMPRAAAAGQQVRAANYHAVYVWGEPPTRSLMQCSDSVQCNQHALRCPTTCNPHHSLCASARRAVAQCINQRHLSNAVPEYGPATGLDPGFQTIVPSGTMLAPSHAGTIHAGSRHALQPGPQPGARARQAATCAIPSRALT